RAGLTVVLFFTLFTGNIALVFCILFIRSAVTKFFFTAENSLVQAILPKEHYVKEAGLNQMLFSIFMVFGVGIAAC
ncbi:MFS transporter, partial [Bacillus subtilis]|nr:MFS transporter [Bacillus subtilis]